MLCWSVRLIRYTYSLAWWSRWLNTDIDSRDWRCPENMAVYLYWSGGYRKVWTWLRLTDARSGDIALSRVCLSHYVRRTVLILCGKTTTWGIFESKRLVMYTPLQIKLSHNVWHLRINKFCCCVLVIINQLYQL